GAADVLTTSTLAVLDVEPWPLPRPGSVQYASTLAFRVQSTPFCVSKGYMHPGCTPGAFLSQRPSILVQIRELLPEMSHVWRIVVNDIRVVRMPSCVILVISLCGIKAFQ